MEEKTENRIMYDSIGEFLADAKNMMAENSKAALFISAQPTDNDHTRYAVGMHGSTQDLAIMIAHVMDKNPVFRFACDVALKALQKSEHQTLPL
jgi:hypothetical protein